MLLQNLKRLIYHPFRSRILYDLFSSGLSVFLIFILIIWQPTPNQYLYLNTILIFPFLLILSNYLFGIYTAFKIVTPIRKTVVLSFSSVFVLCIYLLTSNFSVYLWITSLFSLILQIIPRWFFNIRQHFHHPIISTITQIDQPILVIGGGGYIGTHLVQQLLDQKAKVRVLDTFYYDKNVFSEYKNNPNLEIHTGDASDLYALTLALKDVQAVVHLAGIVGDPACAIDDQLTRHINIATTRMVKDSLKAFRIPKFIFASSCSVYGASDEIVDENSRLNPVSMYAQTKIDSEKEILADTFDAFHPTILRFATVFGHSKRMRFDLVTNLFTAQAHHQGSISVEGGDQWRPFIHVADIATAIIKVLKADHKKTSRQIFNVGDQNLNITIADLASLVSQVVQKDKHGNPVQIHINSSVPDRRNYHVSFQKIQSKLGFCAQYDLQAGIKEIFQHLLTNTYSKEYTDPLYSNLEMTKLINETFQTQEYQQKHFTLLNTNQSLLPT